MPERVFLIMMYDFGGVCRHQQRILAFVPSCWSIFCGEDREKRGQVLWIEHEWTRKRGRKDVPFGTGDMYVSNMKMYAGVVALLFC